MPTNKKLFFFYSLFMLTEQVSYVNVNNYQQYVKKCNVSLISQMLVFEQLARFIS